MQMFLINYSDIKQKTNFNRLFLLIKIRSELKLLVCIFFTELFEFCLILRSFNII